jgi:hypothetical protein
VIDFPNGSRRRDLVHHAVKWGARIPRIGTRQPSPRELASLR